MLTQQWTAYATDVPGDGTCLFHAIGYQFKLDGHFLRKKIINFLVEHPDATLHDQSLRNWIQWDEGISLESYIRKLKAGKWGGALETTILASMLNTRIFVYEPKGNLCRRVSEALPDSSIPKLNVKEIPFICVLWLGKSHYMSLRATKTNANE